MYAGALNDYQKDQQFRKLNAQKDTIDIKTMRGGQMIMVSNHELVVGDVVLLDAGDKIIADCLVCGDVQGLVLDEASLTGESDPVKKNKDSDPWIRSGTQVSEGSGKAVVVAVGVNSEWGKTITLLGEAGDEQTPLQEKLERLAKAIGLVGLTVAVACFIAMLVK
jgi:Ca2+-transporting ATPase